MTAPPAGFAGRIVRWQRTHGRNSLPWQATRDPYRVWLSEIMLQQTQVATVLDYYTRFLDRFAHVQALAAAELDEVYALWSGLGYYSRARNLHRCAREVVAAARRRVSAASRRSWKPCPASAAPRPPPSRPFVSASARPSWTAT